MATSSAGTGEGPGGVPETASPQAGLARDSASVAVWTLVSRVVGLLRVVTIAAVLGPTYFGNVFQATNLLPNLTYEFLTGALFTSLLVPSLVRHDDEGDTDGVARTAGGFLGVVLLGFSAVTIALMLAGPLIMRLLTAGVDDADAAADQQRVGLVLLLLLMPQVVLYGVAATGAAVQNARGRFALAAAAPAIESVGVIATMGLSAVIFGTGNRLADVGTGQLVLLGAGTTASVGLHAAVQWWGAKRVGVRLLPRAGWRDAEVRDVLRRVVPSLGYAGLNSLRVLAVLVVANRVPGGVVAFQLALNFFHLPVATFARPVATAMLPRLSRHHQAGASPAFRDELARAGSLAMFFVIPAALAYAVLAYPLARAAALGEMATPTGISMVALSTVALAVGVVGESAFVVSTYASYARRDASAPLRAMVVKCVVAAAGIAVAFAAVEGTAVLVVLGLSVSAGSLASAAVLGRHVRSGLPAGTTTAVPALVRAVGAAAVMAGPAYLVAVHVPSLPWESLRAPFSLLLGSAVGLLVYVAVQVLWRSPEVASLRTELGRRGART